MGTDTVKVKIETSTEKSVRGFFVASGEQPPEAVSTHSLPEALLCKVNNE